MSYLNNVRRNSFEITADILRVARHGARKTRIVYKANLNFEILGKYLGRLEKQGLVAYNRQTVKTTDRGLEYIKRYESLNDFVDLRSELKETTKKWRS